MTYKEQRFLEELKQNFFNTADCQLCGSQRCDGSADWLDGCPNWHEHLVMTDNVELWKKAKLFNGGESPSW